MADQSGPGTTVQVEHLGQRYGSRWVFRSLTFSVGAGVVGLLGPNGAGKTTLLTTLATLRRPAGGSVRLLGLDPWSGRNAREVRRRLGYVPQTFGYPSGFTAAEFVTYVGWTKGMSDRAARAAAAAALDSVDLADRSGQPLRTLSGGMIRRVAIAAALVNDPALLLLDEPTAGLDPEQRVEFRSLLRRIGRSSSVLVSTHLVEDVASICEQVLILHAGVLAYQGDLARLAAEAAPDVPGDVPLERGYSSALRRVDAGKG